MRYDSRLRGSRWLRQLLQRINLFGSPQEMELIPVPVSRPSRAELLETYRREGRPWHTYRRRNSFD